MLPLHTTVVWGAIENGKKLNQGWKVFCGLNRKIFKPHHHHRHRQSRLCHYCCAFANIKCALGNLGKTRKSFLGKLMFVECVWCRISDSRNAHSVIVHFVPTAEYSNPLKMNTGKFSEFPRFFHWNFFILLSENYIICRIEHNLEHAIKAGLYVRGWRVQQQPEQWARKNLEFSSLSRENISYLIKRDDLCERKARKNRKTEN